MTFLDYFFDPVVRAPTLGCMLMCVAASLMGVVLMLQKRLLVGESISHAAYPGAIAGLIALAAFGPEYEEWVFAAVLAGALGSSYLGMVFLNRLELRHKIKSDAALCLIVALFFGFGILLSSVVQASMPIWASQAYVLLFGQAATLTDEHIFVYGALAISCLFFLFMAYHPIQALLFDRGFANAIGIKSRTVERILFWLLLLSIIVGIRSVGVILMSGMLIAPAVAARQWSNRLLPMFAIAAAVGALSGFLGSVLSIELAIRTSISLPSGPVIILTGACFAFLSLLLAPKRGLISRMARLAAFRVRCLEENILKGLWHNGEMGYPQLKRRFPNMLGYILFRLQGQGWIVRNSAGICLSADGRGRAAGIVRLHRLWEVYLTEQLGIGAHEVHAHAEEMEHILTPELEERLTHLLADPQQDPHDQPIPQRRPNL